MNVALIVTVALFSTGGLWLVRHESRRLTCPMTGKRHEWEYAGPTGPDWDRRCLFCGMED